MYIPKSMTKDLSKRKTCPVCKGEKIVTLKDGTKEDKIPCPRCGGRGFI